MKPAKLSLKLIVPSKSKRANATRKLRRLRSIAPYSFIIAKKRQAAVCISDKLYPFCQSRACCPTLHCAYSSNPGKQFLPLDSSTLLPVATLRPLLLQVRIHNGCDSECGYPQTYVRVNSYSSQSVAGVATLRVPATTLVCPAVCQEGLRTLAPRTASPLCSA